MEILQLILLSIFILIGFYIAHRVCKGTRLIIRLILLAPLLTACFKIIIILEGNYISHFVDAIREIGWIATYILIAMLLAGKRLLRNIDMEREKNNA